MKKLNASENLPMPQMLKAADVLKLLNISRATLTRWQQKGLLPKPIKIGRTVFWRATELHKHISKNLGE